MLTAFLNPDGKAGAGPAGVAVGSLGAVQVADDVGGMVWRITPE